MFVPKTDKLNLKKSKAKAPALSFFYKTLMKCDGLTYGISYPSIAVSHPQQLADSPTHIRQHLAPFRPFFFFFFFNDNLRPAGPKIVSKPVIWMVTKMNIPIPRRKNDNHHNTITVKPTHNKKKKERVCGSCFCIFYCCRSDRLSVQLVCSSRRQTLANSQTIKRSFSMSFPATQSRRFAVDALAAKPAFTFVPFLFRYIAIRK